MKYQQAIEELESIVREIENETIGMDDLSEKVKRAAELVSYCRKVLNSTETEVQNILKELKGSDIRQGNEK
jgi:exodeoxyribonuclease VII small subunit